MLLYKAFYEEYEKGFVEMKKLFLAVVGVGKLNLLTKFVGALLFVVALGGNATGQTITINVAYNLTWQEENADCDGNYVFSATGQWGAFNIKIGNTDLSSLGYTYTGGHLNGGLAQNCQLNTSGRVYFLVNTSNKTITSSKQKFKCSNDGPVVIPTSEIITINDITVGSVNGETIEKLPCSDKALFHVTGGNNGIYIFAKGKNIIDDPSDYYSMSNPQNIEVLKWSNSFFNKKNCYYTIEVKESDIEVKTYSSLPECGPKKPVIPEINDVCIESIASLSEPKVTWGQAKLQAFWSKDGTNSFTPSSSTLNIGEEFYYVAKDANGADPVLSNKIKVMGKPSISPIGDISYCAADGGYDLSKHIVTDNGATTTTTWKLNETTISNSSSPTLQAGDELYIEAKNTCGTTSATMNVSNGCTPKIPTLSNPTAICSGGSIVLPTPTLEYYDESLQNNTKEWQVSTDGGNTWKTFGNSNLSYSTYNGAKIRLKATNEVGTEYSNEITLTVNSDAPGFTYTKSPNQTTLSQTMGGTPASVTYTLKKDNECNSDPISISINNSSDFEISGNTVKLKGGKGVGTYTTTVTFTQAGETKTDKVTVEVVEWPKCFKVRRVINEGTENAITDYVDFCTDENGNIDIDLSKGGDTKIYVTNPNNSGVWPSDRWCYKDINFYFEEDIVCNNFKFYGLSANNCSPDYKFYLKSTIECKNFEVDIPNDKRYVEFDCSSKIHASEKIDIYYHYSFVDVKGQMVAPIIDLANGNNTGINFDKCSFVKAETLTLKNEPNQITVDGHIISENISSSAKIILEYNPPTTAAILTIGNLNSNIMLVINENTTLNLCYNSTKNTTTPHTITDTWYTVPIYDNHDGSDYLAICYGSVLYLADNTTGYTDSWNPEMEGDINGARNEAFFNTYANNKVPKTSACIPAYSSYDDCIEEKGMASFLGMDDDPFLPKDKEIYQLYNCNPCSKDFENTKIEIREIHGKTFRLINGELIYCENDN